MSDPQEPRSPTYLSSSQLNIKKPFWANSSSIRSVGSRQQIRPAPLVVTSVQHLQHRSTSPAGTLSPISQPVSLGGTLSKTPGTPGTLLHPSDYGDPDEARDFSTVKPLRLKASLKRLLPHARPASQVHSDGEQRSLSVPLEPAHGLYGGTSIKQINSWPSQSRALLSSSRASERPALPDVADGAHATSIVTLQHVREFVEDEMRLVSRADHGAVLNVYREAFVKVVDEFPSFRAILGDIRNAYETRLCELEETCHSYLMGDPEVQAEKEKILQMQSDLMAAFEKEKRSVDALRVRAADSEAARTAMELDFEQRISAARQEAAELRHELLKERTVRLEHEDNLNTALRLMHEAQERAAVATSRLDEVQNALESETARLRRELSLCKKDLESVQFKADQSLEHAEKKYKELALTCVDEQKLSDMRAAMEKVGKTNVVLSRRNQWLEQQYNMFIKPAQRNGMGAPVSSVAADAPGVPCAATYANEM